MIVVDSSVWINHFRVGLPRLSEMLEQEQVLVHPFVLGEIACGNLKNRREILALMRALPAAPKASDDEVLSFIDRHALNGRGIGLVDVHLLASCLLHSSTLWTDDARLKAAAEALNTVVSF